jgi:hypothetical protein
MTTTNGQVKPITKPSRKSKVHALYSSQGAEAAFVLGTKLKLKAGTLRTWIAHWRRTEKVAKPAVKKPAKADAVKKPAKGAAAVAA